MKVEDIKRQGAIYFERIEDGFEQYSYYFLEGTKKEVCDRVRDIIENEGFENCYVDFYYNQLHAEEKRIVEQVLTKDEFDYIITNTSKESIFYPLTKRLLEITLKLSIDEILFSSFYCCKTPLTIWGNYNNKFPVFYN